MNEKYRKLIIGGDPGGFALKNEIYKHLVEEGYEVTDVDPGEPILFQDVAKKVAQGVQSGEYKRGIAICGTGMGVSIICNKHRGVYAALCESVYQARRASQVNNTNVLCMGGFIIGFEMGKVMTDAWLEQNYLEGLDEETRKTVEHEYDQLVMFEDTVY